ncbi:MAG: hypothetical protein JOZ96_28325 [Acidobacteria bacterium]|nr:hypothetical protein [Acidobacteriota bacterium]
MQNYGNPTPPPPQAPQGGYGTPPQPPAKKGMSTGMKILIVVIVLVVGGGVVLAVAGGGLVWYLSRKAQETASTRSRDALKGLAGSSSSSGGDIEAEAPSPTSEQQAAIAGGQTAKWEQQEISWTVPQTWKKDTASSTQLTWSSPGSWDAAHLIVSISPMAADFPEEISLKANYDSFKRDPQKYEEVRWVKFGDAKGVLFREAAPESGDNPRRLQWIGFRDYKGQKQMVNIMLAAQGKYFARHEDAMYGILYSTELGE